ncbi:MAG: tetratricopeptide repeat protein [Candidatus Melainabacteria bacterium]|nr:tetratricopeptide repeat protein [Candidatus Melainabacteria bacterium]
MKALAFATVVTLSFSMAVFAQISKSSLESDKSSKPPTKAAAGVDVAAIQKKIDDYTAAIKDDPGNDKYYGARGQNFEKLGNYTSALNDYNCAIALNPNRQAYFIVRANLHAVQKQFGDAYEDYSRAIACGPVTQGLFRAQGSNALLLGEYDKALVSARNAINLNENDWESLVLLGSVELMKGMFSDSVKHLTRAIEINPAVGGAYSIRADAFAKLGKTELAKRDKAKARELGFFL